MFDKIRMIHNRLASDPGSIATGMLESARYTDIQKDSYFNSNTD